MSPVVAAVTVAVSTDPFVASSPAPAKAAGATMRTVAESAASAAASSLNCISVFRTITLALPSGPLCLRLDGCARVWAARICVGKAVPVSGHPRVPLGDPSGVPWKGILLGSIWMTIYTYMDVHIWNQIWISLYEYLYMHSCIAIHR